MKARVRKFKYRVVTGLNGNDKVWFLNEKNMSSTDVQKLIQSFMATYNLTDTCESITVIDDVTKAALQFIECLPADIAAIAVQLYELSDNRFFSFVGYRSDINSIGVCFSFDSAVFDISKKYVWDRRSKKVVCVDDIEKGVESNA